MALSLLQLIILAILILCPFLWFKSHVFRYYVKFTYYNVVCGLFIGIFVFSFSIFRPRDVRNLRLTGWAWYHLFAHVFGLEYHIRNEENMVSDRPYILVSNHQSSIDVIGMMRFLPDRCSALAKKELLYVGTFGLGAWLCGLVFVDRLNKEKAKETMQKTAQYLLDNNIKLWVYPEGTRNLNGSMLPFKKGAFHLAIQAQIPVVPVVFSSYANFMDKKRHIFEPGKILIEALPPIPTEGLTGEDVNELTERVRDKMMEKFKALSKEAAEISPPLNSRI